MAPQAPAATAHLRGRASGPLFLALNLPPLFRREDGRTTIHITSVYGGNAHDPENFYCHPCALHVSRVGLCDSPGAEIPPAPNKAPSHDAWRHGDTYVRRGAGHQGQMHMRFQKGSAWGSSLYCGSVVSHFRGCLHDVTKLTRARTPSAATPANNT